MMEFMLPEDRSFFVKGDDGEDYGPVGLEELREWVRENRAGLGTTVKLNEPGSLWQPWQYHPELVALLAEARVMSPVPGVPGLTIAPVGKRVLAGVLDYFLGTFLGVPIFIVLAIVFMPEWTVQFGLASMDPREFAQPQMPILGTVVESAVLILYMACFHAAHGRTPGKSVMRIRVVDERGGKPHFVKALLRALAYGFSIDLLFIPIMYLFFNPQRRAFHDFVAATYVVEK